MANPAETLERIRYCYEQYCAVIKPLVAQIEALSEKIPLQLLNEIRAFNDHIARCFYHNPPADYIDEQVARAERHIIRITLDCFKCLNVIRLQQIELFESQTKNVDLSVVDNGLFYPEYSLLKIDAAKAVKQAKLTEATDINCALELYQQAYNTYTRITDKIEAVTEKVRWAKVRFTRRRWLTALCWLASVVISAVISALLSN